MAIETGSNGHGKESNGAFEKPRIRLTGEEERARQRWESDPPPPQFRPQDVGPLGGGPKYQIDEIYPGSGGLKVVGVDDKTGKAYLDGWPITRQGLGEKIISGITGKKETIVSAKKPNSSLRPIS